ncbi:hypothetical protein BDK51DRAFT_38977 [Blyttiomyces helicus]|uniref:Uncharacterized protein n=1 Tax=Blyttiomyces helicus TaxID=388810 RepID=A0A4P9W9N1_9FUNG|nr:hypothetical protein BDK51DRAFT_38977 [Blyttiomyces helicus]|eukprot:RKO87838.1 hypothetical protein BDK51DRAFT_38977 [Blyttiomyces helicus]
MRTLSGGAGRGVASARIKSQSDSPPLTVQPSHNCRGRAALDRGACWCLRERNNGVCVRGVELAANRSSMRDSESLLRLPHSASFKADVWLNGIVVRPNSVHVTMDGIQHQEPYAIAALVLGRNRGWHRITAPPAVAALPTPWQSPILGCRFESCCSDLAVSLVTAGSTFQGIKISACREARPKASTLHGNSLRSQSSTESTPSPGPISVAPTSSSRALAPATAPRSFASAPGPHSTTPASRPSPRQDPALLIDLSLPERPLPPHPAAVGLLSCLERAGWVAQSWVELDQKEEGELGEEVEGDRAEKSHIEKDKKPSRRKRCRVVATWGLDVEEVVVRFFAECIFIERDTLAALLGVLAFPGPAPVPEFVIALATAPPSPPALPRTSAASTPRTHSCNPAPSPPSSPLPPPPSPPPPSSPQQLPPLPSPAPGCIISSPAFPSGKRKRELDAYFEPCIFGLNTEQQRQHLSGVVSWHSRHDKIWARLVPERENKELQDFRPENASATVYRANVFVHGPADLMDFMMNRMDTELWRYNRAEQFHIVDHRHPRPVRPCAPFLTPGTALTSTLSSASPPAAELAQAGTARAPMAYLALS